MDSFFTWQGLLTYSDATLATAIVTQFLKELKWFRTLKTRALSYLIALTLLILATLLNTGFDAKQLALTLINAVVVSLAANGAYDTVVRK